MGGGRFQIVGNFMLKIRKNICSCSMAPRSEQQRRNKELSALRCQFSQFFEILLRRKFS